MWYLYRTYHFHWNYAAYIKNEYDNYTYQLFIAQISVSMDKRK